jgi:hypothetical protein
VYDGSLIKEQLFIAEGFRRDAGNDRPEARATRKSRHAMLLHRLDAAAAGVVFSRQNF